MAGISVFITQDAILEFGMFDGFLFRQGSAALEERNALHPNFRIDYDVHVLSFWLICSAVKDFHALSVFKLDDTCENVQIYCYLPCIQDCQQRRSPLQTKRVFALLSALSSEGCYDVSEAEADFGVQCGPGWTTASDYTPFPPQKE